VDVPDVVAPPGGEIEVDDGGMITVDGPTTVDPGGKIVIDAGGMIIVSGPITVDPGADLEITVGGPLCQDSGKLLINGHITLAGTLTLSSFNNFVSSSGDHYTILVATGGISGMFSQVVDTLNTSGLTRADIYAPNGLVIAYLPPGHGALTDFCGTNTAEFDL